MLKLVKRFWQEPEKRKKKRKSVFAGLNNEVSFSSKA